jgi:nucleotide-binding universal stress UspA family protein
MAHAAQVVFQSTLKNILYTTDFSACSEAALPYARSLAERYGATVHMVHVIGAEPVFGELGVPYGDVESENRVARQQFDLLEQSDALKGILFTHSVQRGSVWEVVSQLLVDLHIDLIVSGTHGRRGLKHFLLGSVAEQIFRRAACPVLTVGPEVRKEGMAQGRLSVILYATDFSSASLHAFGYAQSLASESGARLALLHALETERAVSRLEEAVVDTNRRLDELMRQSSGVSCDPIIMSGSAAESILRAARSAEADLIVMGAHPGASTSAHTPCAVAHRVVCHASCPVLTVRA